jgi:cytochrome bd-type quinol oxidase subunit 2
MQQPDDTMYFSHSPELWLPTPAAMGVILVSACIALPVIVGYTIFAYRVFWGKSTALKY